MQLIQLIQVIHFGTENKVKRLKTLYLYATTVQEPTVEIVEL